MDEDGWCEMRRTVDGWALLAAAIIDSGKRANDEEFLKSEWHEELKQFVAVCLDLNSQDDTNDPHIFLGGAHGA